MEEMETQLNQIHGPSKGVSILVLGTTLLFGVLVGWSAKDVQGQGLDGAPKGFDAARLWEVWNTLKQEAYQPITDEELFSGALRGIAEATKDPYTTYFDPKETDEFLSDLEGKFEGIGAQLGRDHGFLEIVAPLPGTPAERAGLLAGDAILKIDGEEVLESTIEEAVRRIRGEKGTMVTLQIARDTLDKPFDVTITRDVIEVASVETTFNREEKLLTVSITSFDTDAPGLVEKALREVSAVEDLNILLDLRGNPGGILSAAVEIGSYWVGDRPVLLEESADGERAPYAFPGAHPLVPKGAKTVVLVDGWSASASEILAGALQDYELATVVGTQSFGKGSVQDLKELRDGSTLKLTIAHWLTPNGHTIHESGITPNVVVEPDLTNPPHDTQKEKALEILRAP